MAAMKDGLGHHLSRKYWPLSVAYQVCSIFRAAVNAATAFSKLNSPKPQKTENWATWCTWPGSKLSGPGRSLQWAFEDRWDIAASACMLGIWIWDYDTKKKQWSCDPQKTIKKGLEKKMSIKIRESWGTTANDFSGPLTSNIIEAVFHLVSVWSPRQYPSATGYHGWAPVLLQIIHRAEQALEFSAAQHQDFHLGIGEKPIGSHRDVENVGLPILPSGKLT